MNKFTDMELKNSDLLRRKVTKETVMNGGDDSCRFYTGFSVAMLLFIFDWVSEKAGRMTYWKGTRTANKWEAYNAGTTSQSDSSSSLTQEDPTDGLSFISQSLSNKGLSLKTALIIKSSWRDGTLKQYKTQLGKWRLFCSDKHIDPLSPTVNDVLNFLTELFEQGAGYNSINTARSALSAIIALPTADTIGKHPLVCRFIKGVFQLRPSLPRYKEIWDVNVVLRHIAEGNADTNLKQLARHLATLMALLSGQRIQTLQLLDINFMQLNESNCVFQIKGLLKQSRPGFHLNSIIFPAYPIDKKLCVVTMLRKYLQLTSSIRAGESHLFLTLNKPHRAASKDIISRWIKATLTDAGVDQQGFKAHSVRASAATAARRSGVPIDTIMKTVGWTNARTFATFYNKPVVERQEHEVFAKTLLDEAEIDVALSKWNH